MRVTVCFGDPCWRLIGKREIEVALYRGATVADALEVVMRRHPKFAPCLQSADSLPPLFLGGDAAAPDSPLAEGARLRITHYAVTNRIAHVCSTT